MSHPSNKGGSLIAIRTNKMDAATCELVEKVSRITDFRVVICADESSSTITVGDKGIHKTSISKSRYSAMGLFVEHDTMWRCGDYCLYAVMQEYPNCERIWMIEPDICINGDVSSFFHDIQAASYDCDFVAVRFSRANERSPWQETMERFYAERYICQYPVVSVTARAVRKMFEQRLRVSEVFLKELALSGTIAAPYPNDEVFTATVCANSGFKCADLNAFGITRYTDNTFSFLIPASRKYLNLSQPDQMVYHPVVSGEAFKMKADFLLEYFRDNVEQAGRLRSMRPVLETLGHKLAIEVDYDYAVDYLSRAQALLVSGST